MNLVTAVLVEHSIMMAKGDREMARHEQVKQIRALIPQLEGLFAELDQDGDGTLTRAEVKTVHSDMQFPADIAHIVSQETLIDLFEALDEDKSGEVDRTEFVEGVIHLLMSEIPLETTKMLHLAREQKQTLLLVEEQMRFLVQLISGKFPSQLKTASGAKLSGKTGSQLTLDLFPVRRSVTDPVCRS